MYLALQNYRTCVVFCLSDVIRPLVRIGAMTEPKKIKLSRGRVRLTTLADNVCEFLLKRLYASTTDCDKLLYTSTIAKMNLKKSIGSCVTSSPWTYSCLLWPQPRSTPKRVDRQGKSRSKFLWHIPSTRSTHSIAMLPLSTVRAKLYSKPNIFLSGQVCSKNLSVLA